MSHRLFWHVVYLLLSHSLVDFHDVFSMWYKKLWWISCNQTVDTIADPNIAWIHPQSRTKCLQKLLPIWKDHPVHVLTLVSIHHAYSLLPWIWILQVTCNAWWHSWHIHSAYRNQVHLDNPSSEAWSWDPLEYHYPTTFCQFNLCHQSPSCTCLEEIILINNSSVLQCFL